MRLNGVIFCVLAGFGSLFLVCSRSDVITDVGSGVVSGVEPALTDFVPIDLSGDDVEPSSLPNRANPTFSTTFGGGCIIGVNGEGDTLAAYVQYNVAADTSQYKGHVELDGVYMYFPANTLSADADGPPDSVSLYRVNKLAASAPVNKDDMDMDAGEDVPCPPETDEEGDGIDGEGEDENDGECGPPWPRKFTFGGGAVDSVKLPRSVAEKIFEARLSNASAGAAFAFNLVDYYGGVRRIQNPYMVIVASRAKEAESEDNADNVRDTVWDTVRAESSRFTAFESGAATRTGQAYSSQRTRRTAVFKISTAKIVKVLDTLPGGYDAYANMHAVITLKPGSTASDYKFFVSDKEFVDSLAAHADSLNERFKNSVSLKRPSGSYTLSIKPLLQSVLDDKNKDCLYVYLRADSDDGVIIWDKTVIRVETAFTPSR